MKCHPFAELDISLSLSTGINHPIVVPENEMLHCKLGYVHTMQGRRHNRQVRLCKPIIVTDTSDSETFMNNKPFLSFHALLPSFVAFSHVLASFTSNRPGVEGNKVQLMPIHFVLRYCLMSYIANR